MQTKKKRETLKKVSENVKGRERRGGVRDKRITLDKAKIRNEERFLAYYFH